MTLHRKVTQGYAIIWGVPGGVCTQCGARYYAANVLKTVEEAIRGRQKAQRETTVPVYSM